MSKTTHARSRERRTKASTKMSTASIEQVLVGRRLTILGLPAKLEIDSSGSKINRITVRASGPKTEVDALTLCADLNAESVRVGSNLNYASRNSELWLKILVPANSIIALVDFCGQAVMTGEYSLITANLLGRGSLQIEQVDDLLMSATGKSRVSVDRIESKSSQLRVDRRASIQIAEGRIRRLDATAMRQGLIRMGGRVDFARTESDTTQQIYLARVGQMYGEQAADKAMFAGFGLN